MGSVTHKKRDNRMLKWSKANAKTERLNESCWAIAKHLDGGRKVYSLDLLSGYSCPFAEQCLSKAVEVDGKRTIKDGPKTEFRCFSASQEVQYTNVYNLRKHNYDTLKQHSDDWPLMYLELWKSMPTDAGIVRIHVAGDFFNQNYLRAWCQLAYENPDVLFYAYTKSLKYWDALRSEIPENLVLTASYGGRDDWMIDYCGFRYAQVVYSEAEARDLGLCIDHDDSMAANPTWRDTDFALLLHGTQPKGSEAATALKALKGKGSYSRKQRATV
jgi:hypothetical protein